MSALLPMLLAVVMEAAWISVLAGLVQEFALREPVIGLAGMAAFVALGMAAGRVLARPLPRQWPIIGTVLVFVAAIAGLLLSPVAREAFRAGGIAEAVGANPAGLLAGVAVLRGYPHSGEHPGVDTAGRALFLGIPVLAVAAAIGGMITEPFRSAFLHDTAIAAALFIVAGLLTLAVAAVADVRPGGAVAWRTNPVWMALVILAIGGLLAVAIPIGLAGGPSIALTLQVVVAGSMIPLAVLGFILGGREVIRRLFLVIIGAAVVEWILSFAARPGSLSGPPPAGVGGGAVTLAMSPAAVAGISGLTTVAIGIVVFLLIRAWMGRHGPLPEDPDDVRSAALPAYDDAGESRRRHRRRPWWRRPRTAVEAYLALVEDLRDEPDVRRRAAETPFEHARRLRLDQLAAENGIGLELLAADYGLGSYAAKPLSAAETRRAIGRWRSLRRLLRIRPADTPARRSTADDEVPPNPMKPSRPD